MLRAQVGLLAALVVGGAVVLAVVALAGGSSGGGRWWAVVAGAFACASGLVLGSTRGVTPAAGLGLVAVVAVVVAAGAEPAGGERLAAAPSVRHEIVRPPATVAGGDGTAGRRPTEGGAERAPAAGRGREARPPVVVPPGDAGGAARLESLVRSYYAALDAREYAEAWERLSPAVQAAFGGFDSWRRGYATTVGHRLEDMQVSGASVRLVLVATDRTPCGGTTEQRFSVRWRLTTELEAAALTAVKLSGVDPATACG
ncbi:MAG: hypothetical protein ACRDPC_08050 [Solirubrobacteraceae bacterium]